jgi:hypothetical protein
VRLITNVLVVLTIGLTLGGASAWYSIQRNLGIGGIQAGPWTAWPFAGGAAADPYTMAKVARDGTIPLGATEGLAFEASRDNSGDPLILNCDYLISGITPPSKLWTLAAYSRDGDQIRAPSGGNPALHSGRLLRFSDGSFRVLVSSRPQPGNWLAVSGEGQFYFVLRVYDTPVTSTSGLVTPQMPNVIKQDCRS